MAPGTIPAPNVGRSLLLVVTSAAVPERRALTSWRTLVVVVAVVVLIVTGATLAVREQIRSRTLANAVQAAGILTSIVIDRSLTLTDITDSMNREHRAELNADVILLKRRDEVLGLAVWSLADGSLVYSDVDPTDVVAPPPETLARAREGQPFVGDGPGRPERINAFVVFYPYDANGDGMPDAVAQVVLPRAEVDEAVARSTRLLIIGGVIVLLVAVAGILQVRQRQIAQDRAAVHDALTGLGNRLLLHRASAPVLAEATIESPAALLIIDLDAFKTVNDTLGHQAGDELLTAVAKTIEQESGPSGVAVRLGGDEFAVLLPRGDERGPAREVAGRIRDAIRRPIMIAGSEVEVDASVGVAYAPTDATDLRDLLRSANVAMYRAKSAGVGIVEYAEAPETISPQPAASTLPGLREALAKDELELYYQPVLAADNSVTSVEALARWPHSEQGMLEAGTFIPLVAHTSLMATLTEWVLGQAAQQCAQWRASGLDVGVSVNIPARSLFSESLLELLRGVAEHHALPLPTLELELAEEVLVREPARALAALRGLHDAGVKLCLDNVGAAYGAVSTIAEAPVHRLKIDRRFGGSVEESALARTVVEGWARLGHQLGLTVVALGAETPGAWRRLIELGCDGVQGYGICRPLPPAELTQWLAEKRTSE
jgi:diguanylate cyclase (GGDEF)-like protein